MGFPEPLAVNLDHRHVPLERELDECHHPGAELGCGERRIIRHRHAIEIVIIAAQRPWPDFDARLLVMLTIALNEASIESLQDHFCSLVEPTPSFRHIDA